MRKNAGSGSPYRSFSLDSLFGVRNRSPVT